MLVRATGTEALQINATGPAMLAGYAWQRLGTRVRVLLDGLPVQWAVCDTGWAVRGGAGCRSTHGCAQRVWRKQVSRRRTGSRLSHPEALPPGIVRTAGVFGEDAQEKNYVYQVLKRLSLGQGVRVPLDQTSTPAYNSDLARATFTLLEHGASGVYNACGPDVLDRVEFARIIAREFGFSAQAIEGVATSTLKQAAERPLAAGLDSSKLQRHFPEARMRGVAEALHHCRPALEASIAAWRKEAAAGNAA